MKGKKLLLKFLITYMLLAVVVLGVMLTALRVVMNAQEEIVQREQRDKMQLITSEIEDRYDQYDEVATLIYRDYRLSGSWIRMSAYNAIEALEELRKYRAKCIDIDEMFLWFYGNEVYSTAGYSDFSIYTERVYPLYENSRAQMTECMQAQRPSLCVMEYRRNQQTNKSLLYFCPVPVNDPRPSSAVGFIVDLSGYQELLETAQSGNGGYMCLRLPDGTVVAECGDPALMDAACAADDGGADVVAFSHGGASYSWQRTGLEGVGLEFHAVTDTRQVMQPVRRLWQMVLWVVAALILISAGLSFLFSHYNYRPIHRLRSAIVALNDEDDDLDAVQKVIHLTMNENQSLMQRVSDSHSLMQEQAVRMMFEGNARDELAARQLLEFTGSKIPLPEGYAVAVVLAPPRSLQLPEAQMKERISFSLQINGQPALCMMLSAEDGEEQAEEEAYLLRSRLGSDGPSARIGVGQAYEEYGCVRRSMNEAIVALNQSKPGETVLFSRMTRMQQVRSGVDEQTRTSLAAAVRRGEADEMLNCLARQMEALRSEAYSPGMRSFLLYDTIHIVLDSLIEMGQEEQYIGLLAGLDTGSLETFEAGMSALLLRIAQSRSRSDFRKTRFSRVIGYLQENYRDSALTVESVAEAFGLTRSYLSRVFREETGCTYIEYVSTLRVEEAKRLLRDTPDSVQQILTSVGYHDAASFHRKFKQMTGMTPLEYRNSIGAS